MGCQEGGHMTNFQTFIIKKATLQTFVMKKVDTTKICNQNVIKKANPTHFCNEKSRQYKFL